MNSKRFMVSGQWNNREGKLVPFFLESVEVLHDVQNYKLVLNPCHRDLLPLIERKLSGILICDDFKSYLFNMENEKVILTIAPGRLGEVLQVLHDNRFMNYATANDILNYHHTLHSQLSFTQQLRQWYGHYAAIPSEAPAPSFRLVHRAN